MYSRVRLIAYLFVCQVFLGTADSSKAQVDQSVYTDAPVNGWTNYSWATVNFNNGSPVRTGSHSISVSCLSNNYQALYLHHNAFDSTPYSNLNFYLYSTTGGNQPLQVQATINGNAQSSYQVPSVSANNWTLISVPLSVLGVAQVNMDGFWIQSQSGAPIPTFYVDDITLVAATNVSSGTNPPAVIGIDAGSNRHAISPLIYGTAFAKSNQLSDLNFTLNRSGGNNETRYNWQTNAHNLDFDYYFESYDAGSPVPGAAADSFVADSKNGGAQPMITIPMIGWAPKLGTNRTILYSYSVSKYGPQASTDQYLPDAGNGIGTNVATHTGFLITNNNPLDANFPVDVSFQQGYVQHLISKWDLSTNGGVKYYFMDNEHSLWFSTHQDVHPVGTTMQEIYNDMISYGSMVKSNDPNALVLGPEEWGWPGYFYSGYYQQWSGASNIYNPAQFPDRGTNGGVDYIPWLLAQIRQHDTNTGKRLLDYLTVHCYPQENNVSGNAVDTATQLLRNQSTRQFWDSSYTDPSWINSIINLIPRLHGWVANYYPGTKIGITEYNWGAEGTMNGATAQADILGIFGRENLDLATRWTTPAASTPTYLAMKMYRNYDGQKSVFGDTSVAASGPNPDKVAVFAATRSLDSALTIMVVGKYPNGVTSLTLNVSNYLTSGPAHVWQLNSSNVIAHMSDVPVNAGTLNCTVPGQSVTLFVIPARPAALVPGAARTDGQFQFSLTGEIGQSWILQNSSNLVTWLSVSTNMLTNTQVNFLVPAAASQSFYRISNGL